MPAVDVAEIPSSTATLPHTPSESHFSLVLICLSGSSDASHKCTAKCWQCRDRNTQIFLLIFWLGMQTAVRGSGAHSNCECWRICSWCWAENCLCFSKGGSLARGLCKEAVQGSRASPESFSLRHCGSSGSLLGFLQRLACCVGIACGPRSVCKHKPALGVPLLGLLVHSDVSPLHAKLRTASSVPHSPKGAVPLLH